MPSKTVIWSVQPITKTRRFVIAVSFVVVFGFRAPAEVDATPPYASLISEVQNLRTDLETGQLQVAHLRALHVVLEINGVKKPEIAEKIEQLAALTRPGDQIPDVTKNFIPLADDLLGFLRTGDLKNSKLCANALFDTLRQAQAHHFAKPIPSTTNPDPLANEYLSVTNNLLDALHRGAIPEAVHAAKEVQSLESSGRLPKGIKSVRAGNIYYVNDAFGREAFLRGDYLIAGDYLLKAADTTGDPALKSFGPDMWLAKALLSKGGYRDVVIAFLERCATFWKEGDPKLTAWLSELKRGTNADLMPNAGRSLQPLVN